MMADYEELLIDLLIPTSLGRKLANKIQLKWSRAERGKYLLNEFTECWTLSCLWTQEWDIRVTTGSSTTTSIHWCVLFKNLTQMLYIKKGLQSSTEIAPSCLTVPASLLPPQNKGEQQNWKDSKGSDTEIKHTQHLPFKNNLKSWNSAFW